MTIQNASGVSADTNSLPSCPGLISEATMPVSSYDTAARTEPLHRIPRARAKTYVNHPARTKWIAIPQVIARSTGTIQRSQAVG